ncbi:MAG: helix-turn-helix domain-containing protein [Betaproteobacteria bacterium]|nr:helix-turn-helix domain-containing protein [Betaproteobacteria bacterium]
MSIDATKWAWECQGLTMTQKLVLLSLADRAGENNECWPSIKRLMKDTCCGHRQTIINALKSLEESGFIATQKVPGKITCYQLTGVKNRHATSTGNDTSTSTKSDTSTGNDTSTGIDVTSTGSGTRPVPKAVLAPNYEPISEPISEPVNQKSFAPLAASPEKKPPPDDSPLEAKPPPPPDAESQKANSRPASNPDALLADLPEGLRADFKRHRKAKRGEITETAIAGIRREAAKAGISFADAVRYSIESNWQGFKANWYLNANGHNARASPSGGKSPGQVTYENGLIAIAKLEAMQQEKNDEQRG